MQKYMGGSVLRDGLPVPNITGVSWSLNASTSRKGKKLLVFVILTQSPVIGYSTILQLMVRSGPDFGSNSRRNHEGGVDEK